MGENFEILDDKVWFYGALRARGRSNRSAGGGSTAARGRRYTPRSSGFLRCTGTTPPPSADLGKILDSIALQDGYIHALLGVRTSVRHPHNSNPRGHSTKQLPWPLLQVWFLRIRNTCSNINPGGCNADTRQGSEALWNEDIQSASRSHLHDEVRKLRVALFSHSSMPPRSIPRQQLGWIVFSLSACR